MSHEAIGSILTRLLWKGRSARIGAIFFLSFQGNMTIALGQSLALPSWDVLADESTVVVTGDVVEGQAWVISPEEKAKAEVTPDGKPTLPNPSKFVLGIVGRVRVKEVLKSDGKVKPGNLVSVFVYGYGGSDSPHVLIKNEVCIAFLRPMKALKSEFEHTVIVPVGTLGSREKHLIFNPSICYTPVNEGFAQVILTPERMKLLDDVKRAIAKSR